MRSVELATVGFLRTVGRVTGIGLALFATCCGIAACGDSSSSSPPTATAQVLFSPEGNNLWAYQLTPPFTAQKVNAANETFDGTPGNPNGWDINGEICSFSANGVHYLITGEDTHQPNPLPGWGIFVLRGNRVSDFSVNRVGRLVPTYQPSVDGPDNYGCGVPSDGRILTTDIGNEAGGPANGPDGTLYYADIGIVLDASGVGPGSKTGSVRRITFTDGIPNPPETIAAHLQFPDGIGLWPPSS